VKDKVTVILHEIRKKKEKGDPGGPVGKVLSGLKERGRE